MSLPDKFGVVVLDVDGAITRQKKLLEKYLPTVIPLQHKSDALRYWCQMEEMNELKQLLVSSVGSMRRKVILYGSGDYHHLAYIGISLVDEPVTVIHFDNHTDFGRVRRGDIGFGSWVTNTLRLPQVRKVVQFGIDKCFSVGRGTPMPSGPVARWVSILSTGKVEIHRNSIRRSVMFGRSNAVLPFVKFRAGLFTTQAIWKNMRDNGGIEATLDAVLPTLPTDAIYLTIDKDVLKESDSFTNYRGDQGMLTLPELLAAVTLIGKEKRVIGADICGDGSYSIRRAGSVKWLTARWMNRKIPTHAFSSQRNISLNEEGNLKILERLEEVL